MKDDISGRAQRELKSIFLRICVVWLYTPIYIRIRAGGVEEAAEEEVQKDKGKGDVKDGGDERIEKKKKETKKRTRRRRRTKRK